MCMRLSPTPKIYMVKKEVPSSITIVDLVFLPTILKSRSSRSKSSSSIISAMFGNVNVISFYIYVYK